MLRLSFHRLVSGIPPVFNPPDLRLKRKDFRSSQTILSSRDELANTGCTKSGIRCTILAVDRDQLHNIKG